MVEKKEITKKSSSNKKRKKITKNKKRIDKQIILGFICLGIILIISMFFILKKEDKIVITIDNIKYTETDFNMYAYLIKYEYFGKDETNLSEDTLKTQISNDSEQTIGEYLKEKTLSKIKVSASILRIANENNITLDEENLKEIENEKDKFVENLGGEKAFKQALKDNGTTEEAYMEVAKINKLYDIVYKSLYKEGKRNDLTLDEVNTYTKSYKNDYVKIKQIILLKKDLNTNTYLDETTLNQKETLAKDLAKQAQEGKSFDGLIIKYSDSYKEEVQPEYYLKKDLVEELKEAINSLDIGDISDVVSTEYAYHIVIREELDDSKLEEYLDSKREEKLIDDVTDNLNKIAIIKSDYLEKISIK